VSRREVVAPDWQLEQGEPVIGKGDHPLRELIADIVDDLDPETRLVIEMYAYERATFQAIADEFGLAGRQSGAYRVEAALKILKEKLLERGVDYAD
jgi:hypothetical protein